MKISSKKFIDYVKIFCISGHGGAGSTHFRREKFIPKGGPDGGDGGPGGSLILEGSNQLWTLFHLKYNTYFKAKNGLPGRSKRMSGAAAEDLILKVPLGTIAKNEQGNIIGNILQEGEQKLLLKGGKGGLGNWHFKNAVNRTPQYAQPGGPGIEAWMTLELKIVADVGLIGFPNAGKSTLLASMTSAKPKIADYAFTTLTPKLGIVQDKSHPSFIMLDLPGILQGASEGKRIGNQFLSHIERNSILVFVIPSDTKDLLKEYQDLLKELIDYHPILLKKKRVLVISKSDLLNREFKNNLDKKHLQDLTTIFISSHHKEGLTQLKEILWDNMNMFSRHR